MVDEYLNVASLATNCSTFARCRCDFRRLASLRLQLLQQCILSVRFNFGMINFTIIVYCVVYSLACIRGSLFVFACNSLLFTYFIVVMVYSSTPFAYSNTDIHIFSRSATLRLRGKLHDRSLCANARSVQLA